MQCINNFYFLKQGLGNCVEKLKRPTTSIRTQEYFLKNDLGKTNMTSRVHCFVGGLSKKKQTLTTIEKALFIDPWKSTFFIMRTRGSCKAHQTFFFIFLHESDISLLCPWWKRYFFHHFPMFFIIFDHVNACANMHSLVEIHNKHFFLCQP